MKNLLYTLYDAYMIECAMRPIWDNENSTKWDEHILVHETLKCIGEDVLNTDLLPYIQDFIEAIQRDADEYTTEHTSALLNKFADTREHSHA